MSSAPRAAVPAGLALVPMLGASCLCPEHSQSSLLRSQGATSSCQTFAGQHKGMEAKLLPLCLWSGRIRVLLGMREWQEGACSVQATATAGRRQEDGDPWVAGGGTGRETTQQQWWRGLEEEGSEGLWRNTSSSASSGSPSHKRTASLQLLSPLLSLLGTGTGSTGGCCPCPGHPAAALGPRVMGYLGVGLLSLPLQEPELLLLLSEEVP